MGGLFRPECALAPWSFGKVVDLAKHRPPPLIVIGTAGMIRVLRATLIDELPKQYVVTARTKGVAETIHHDSPRVDSHDPTGRLTLYQRPPTRGVKLASAGAGRRSSG
ncbi:MAG: hypothetical protein OXP69_12375 [Spirochaetaceae bacterium]|nr:hypothetical protein [Spirochaetaceae bacterium]